MGTQEPFPYDLAITGGHCLTLDSGFTEIPDSLLLIKDGNICYLGGSADYPGTYRADKTLQASGKFIMPAFINAHTHLSLSLYRGIGSDLELHDWLRKVIWPLERQFCTPDNVYLGSCLSLLEMIKSGTGTLADMNFFSGYAGKAIDESGLRGFLGEALFSTPTPSIADPNDGFNVLQSLAERYKDHPLIGTYLVVHAPFSCSAELYAQAALKGKEWGIKVCSHLAETQKEVQQIGTQYGLTPVQWVDSTGVIDKDFIAIHAVHLTPGDIDLLSERGAGIIHCPHSNMMLGSGVSPVPDLLDHGIRVGIGTDSSSSNNSLSILSELQTAAKLHKLDRLDPKSLPARQALHMATSVNADILGLSGVTGTLQKDYSADLILIDPDTPNMVPMHDHYSQIVYSMENRNIDTLVVHGQVIMENRKILTLDEELILKEVDKWMERSSVFDFINL
ncbi:MAG: amidohydrolase [Bacteroidota bacterium]